MRSLSTIFLFLFLSAGVFSQTYKMGDTLNESIEVYDQDKNKKTLKIPEGNVHTIVYRYNWVNVGKGVDIKDTIDLLQTKIDNMLLIREIEKVRVICISYDRGTTFDKWSENIKKEKPFKRHPKYEVEYYNTGGNDQVEKKCRDLFSKFTLIGPKGTLLRYARYTADVHYNLVRDKVMVKAKLLTNNKGVKEPLNNATVHLESTNATKDTLAKATTNKYGDFEMVLPNNKQEYIMRVAPKDTATDNVVLSTPEGKEISTMQKSSGGFEYRLLKTDVTVLSEIPAEDVTMRYNIFYFSKEKELTTIENIYYELGKADLHEYSQMVLDRIVKILNDNPTVTVEISSHTDAQGDDKTNKTLSEKRATAVTDYLTKKGIGKDRLKAIGKGESAIRNRCGNGVPCSDKEHEYNRRTEFKFIRP